MGTQRQWDIYLFSVLVWEVWLSSPEGSLTISTEVSEPHHPGLSRGSLTNGGARLHPPRPSPLIAGIIKRVKLRNCTHPMKSFNHVLVVEISWWNMEISPCCELCCDAVDVQQWKSLLAWHFQTKSHHATLRSSDEKYPRSIVQTEVYISVYIYHLKWWVQLASAIHVFQFMFQFRFAGSRHF